MKIIMRGPSWKMMYQNSVLVPAVLRPVDQDPSTAQMNVE